MKYPEYTNKILQGNSLEVLKTLPDDFVDCCVSSPPYWSLRDYGLEATCWDGDPNCKHEWIEHIKKPIGGKGSKSANVGANKNDFSNMRDHNVISNFCNKCNAWKGQLGLEPTFDLYIKHLCNIFDEVKRVLKPTGTCWINLGDTYGGSGKGAWTNKDEQKEVYVPDKKPEIENGVSKSLCLVPQRFQIEMVNRGWICRNTIIWQKPNCMPSSASDRFTVDFEYIFFFTKQDRYFFEQQFEDYLSDPHGGKFGHEGNKDSGFGVADAERFYNGLGRNKRCVWTLNTKPYKEAHFAVFPPELPINCIKAGCPEQICNKCERAREKVYQRKEYLGESKAENKKIQQDNSDLIDTAGGREHYITTALKNPPDKIKLVNYLRSYRGEYSYKQLDNLLEKEGDCVSHWFTYPDSEHGFSYPCPEDWLKLKDILKFDITYDKQMTETVDYLVDDSGKSNKLDFIGLSDCGCNAGFHSGLVLDPFAGSGTTLEVARKLGMKYLGIELNKEYIKLIEDRLRQEMLF